MSDDGRQGLGALVRQKHSNGCGAAALAMLLGCSYDDAVAKLVSDPEILNESGLGYHHVECQLVEHGYAVSRKWRVFQPGNQHRSPGPCAPFADLHWCQVDAGGRGAHAVVMLRDGTVLDPMRDAPARLTDYRQVDFVAAVIPLRETPARPHRPPEGE